MPRAGEDQIPKDSAAVVAAADAIRRVRAEQLHLQREESVLPWRQLTDQAKLVWLEQAYACISAWTVERPPKD